MGQYGIMISSAAIWLVRHFWMIDISELWISTKDSTDHSWMKLVTTNRPLNVQKRDIYFSMIWFNHTFGQICLLTVRTVLLDDRRGPWASNFLNFIKNQYNLLNLFLFQIPSSTPSSSIYELLNALTSSQTRNPLQTSPFVLHSIPPLYLSNNRVNSKTPHRTKWTPNHLAEQCELQTTPLNNVNSRSTHWTMRNPVHTIELFELQTTSMSNVNSR